MTKKEDNQVNTYKENDQVNTYEENNSANLSEEKQNQELDNAQNVNQETEQEIHTDDNETKEQEKEAMLQKILEHPIKTVERDPMTEEILKDDDGKVHIIVKPVREIIDPVRDIWFSDGKNKPIIKDPGMKKLIYATGAEFPKKITIEKQSDFTSKDREQVVIEAFVVFPNESENDDYGIANRSNCKDPVSSAILPIMARKRAMHRAFYRSDYIGLYDIYDENEVLDAKDEKFDKERINLQNEIQRLREEKEMWRRKVSQIDNKNKKLKNQLCKEIKTSDGELVWNINDMEKLIELGKGNKGELVPYIATLRMTHLKNKGKANS
jgi:hypothetical protein